MTRTETILQFWFQGISDADTIDKNQPPAKRWFSKNADFDNSIRQHFLSDWQHAQQTGKIISFTDGKEALAFIILNDQFSRNMFRNTPEMFASDPLALTASEIIIDSPLLQDISLIGKVFAYLPFMHAEDEARQNQSVKLFSELIHESELKSPHNTAYYRYNLTYAQKHQAIISRFGRFPHRNAILGRASTADEEFFLTTPGSKFYWPFLFQQLKGSQH